MWRVITVQSGLKLNAVLGIPLVLHSSWLLFWGISAWLIAVEGAPYASPENEPSASWLRALWTNILFLGSVVLHELAHLAVAVRLRLPLGRLVIFPFGGVLTLKRRPPSWREGLLLAVAGPLTSAVAGLLLLALAPAGTRPLATWVALFNLVLAFVNLLPAEPLDGAGLLRALGRWRGANIGKLTGFTFRVADRLGTGLVWLGLAAVVILGRTEGLLLILSGCLFQLANNVYRVRENPRRRHVLRQTSMKTAMATLDDPNIAVPLHDGGLPPPGRVNSPITLPENPPESSTPLLPIPGDGLALTLATPSSFASWSVPASATLLEALDRLERPETPAYLFVVEGHKIVGVCSHADLLHYLSRILGQPA